MNSAKQSNELEAVATRNLTESPTPVSTIPIKKISANFSVHNELTVSRLRPVKGVSLFPSLTGDDINIKLNVSDELSMLNSLEMSATSRSPARYSVRNNSSSVPADRKYYDLITHRANFASTMPIEICGMPSPRVIIVPPQPPPSRRSEKELDELVKKTKAYGRSRRKRSKPNYVPPPKPTFRKAKIRPSLFELER
jgi:hypothetical protein